MPHSIQVVESYPMPVDRVYSFFASPAEVVAIAPPGMKLVEQSGDTFKVSVRRWGLSRTIETEVVERVPGSRLVEVQRSGPLKSWRLERVFRAVSENETELTERIEWEPPGGLLGLTLTAARIEAELRAAYEGRRERVLGRMAVLR